MSLISIQYVFSTGATIISSQHNTNFSVIYNDYNGNITDANIAANAGIEYTKLALSNSIKQSDLTSTFNSSSGFGLIPSGGIILWSGAIASIPTGWYLCNGNNGTPDLRNRFVVAADADSGGIAMSTITGSSLQTSDGQIPAHTHTVTAQYNPGNGAAGSGNSGGNPLLTTSSFGTGTYNVARFYALAYIMKS